MDTRTVKLTALRPLVGSYGHVFEGQSFQVSPEDAESLEARGLAERYRPAVRFAVPTFTTKITEPAENKIMPLETVASKRANRK